MLTKKKQFDHLYSSGFRTLPCKYLRQRDGTNGERFITNVKSIQFQLLTLLFAPSRFGGVYQPQLTEIRKYVAHCYLHSNAFFSSFLTNLSCIPLSVFLYFPSFLLFTQIHTFCPTSITISIASFVQLKSRPLHLRRIRFFVLKKLYVDNVLIIKASLTKKKKKSINNLTFLSYPFIPFLYLPI